MSYIRSAPSQIPTRAHLKVVAHYLKNLPTTALFSKALVIVESLEFGRLMLLRQKSAVLFQVSAMSSKYSKHFPLKQTAPASIISNGDLFNPRIFNLVAKENILLLFKS